MKLNPQKFTAERMPYWRLNGTVEGLVRWSYQGNVAQYDVTHTDDGSRFYRNCKASPILPIHRAIIARFTGGV